MVAGPENLNPNVELSELFDVKRFLDNLRGDVIEKSVTKAPYESNGAIIFDYEKDGKKFQVVTRKQGDTYSVRVNEYKFIAELGKKGWKNLGESTFTVTNEASFKSEFGKILDQKIGKDRDKLPKTSGKVYDLLGKQNASNKKDGSDNKESKETTAKTDLKKKPIDLKYTKENKEKKENVNYPRNPQTVEGRITRCLRFQSITDAIEDRYGIPRGLLMAMMAQEGCGDPTVINKRTNYKYVGKNKGNYVRESYKDKKGHLKYRYKKVAKGKGDYDVDQNKSCDGGAGLIHIQAANAAAYGMKTLKRSTNGMVDYPHGELLEKAKKETGLDLAKLSELDDRFNPILAIDVAARFLMEFGGGKYKNTGDGWMDTICKYAGRGMSDYGYSVLVYWTTINKIRGRKLPTFKNKETNKVINGEASAIVNGKRENTTLCINRTKTAMDNLNPTLNGEQVSLDDYYKYEKGQWDNYGLQKYIDYNKKHPYIK